MDECNGLRIGREMTYGIGVYSSFITECVLGPVNSFYHPPKGRSLLDTTAIIEVQI